MLLLSLLLYPVFALAADDNESKQLNVRSIEFWSQIIAILFLVLLSGIIAGLTLGLMSLDTTNLKILQLAGTPKQQKYATRILPIRKNGHILLTTLLLTNTVLNETLPILFDGIFCKEIIPQAICSKHGLAIGALFAIPVRILIAIWLIISWPISKCLDWMLGPHNGFSYTVSELKALIHLHDMTKSHSGCLKHEVSTILQNVLTMQEQTVDHLIGSDNNLLLIPSDTILSQSLVSEYISHGYSHMLVCEPKGSPMEEDSVIGVIALTNLHKEEAYSNPVGNMKLDPYMKIGSSTPIADLLLQVVERKHDQVILVYRTEQDIEMVKMKRAVKSTASDTPSHKRSIRCRLKRCFGCTCQACSEERITTEEEKTIDNSIISAPTTIDIELQPGLVDRHDKKIHEHI
ncbi:hypothetical protein G6F70_003467 [Rhizopus microsporus]|nr:hypothetical protein G6F71_003422 [Rhizopus microsporus]KAG1201090.1 hypothetical protein G6F70_003467 [Rhizopus microsporus]KAG1213053.1 hypothetical protein G6F69_003155 [Rhizopus microsporus]KAG1235104.1 hypothetical protein G6F67_003017 [Rhizopus microsporus]KAG1267218.1 hypothetical protein G6F68_002115 [Rhizopus microsporus]